MWRRFTERGREVVLYAREDAQKFKGALRADGIQHRYERQRVVDVCKGQGSHLLSNIHDHSSVILKGHPKVPDKGFVILADKP
jgi:hypothetical protein